jgi:hypothetical protein
LASRKNQHTLSLGAYPRRSIFTLLNFKAENKWDLYHLGGLVGPEGWKICGKKRW